MRPRLSQRHAMWGEFWAGSGYIAILVDGFGPRGYPQGFPRFSYEGTPARAQRGDDPAARRLRRARLPALAPGRTTPTGSASWAGPTAAVPRSPPWHGMRRASARPTPATGFRAALAFYPACGLRGRFDGGYRPYAPVRIFHGTDDEEVSPRRCGTLVEKSRALGGDMRIRVYEGATPRLRRSRPQAPAPAGQRRRLRGRCGACAALLRAGAGG